MRTATVKRQTRETEITVTVTLDGTGRSAIATGVGFFDHMLDQVARHGLIDLEITAKGDTHIDDHHTVEDVGITLGQAVKKALGDMRGIVRYADATIPMDETLTRAAIDISGRPVLGFRVPFPTAKIGTFDTELVAEFFRAFATNAGVTLHVDSLVPGNAHHMAEGCFKALARVLRAAAAVDPRAPATLPTTKGRIGD